MCTSCAVRRGRRIDRGWVQISSASDASVGRSTLTGTLAAPPNTAVPYEAGIRTAAVPPGR
jgi:hypothetical protein